MPPRKKGKVTSAAVDHSERLKELLSECRCARPNRPKIEKLLDLLPPDTDALRQAMFAAVRQQRADVLEWVLKRGADANVSEDDTASAWRALPIAIGNTCCPCVSLLLAHGAKLAQRDVNQAVHGLHGLVAPIASFIILTKVRWLRGASRGGSGISPGG